MRSARTLADPGPGLRIFRTIRPFQFTFLIAAALTAGAGLAAAMGGSGDGWNRFSSIFGAGVSQSPDGGEAEYVQQARLSPQLRDALRVMGDRLESPGRERLILAGRLKRPRISASEIGFRLILERPDRLRYEEQDGDKLVVTVFDGKQLVKSGGVIKESDEDEIESLLFDSADRFFLGEMRGQGTRFLGSRFRLDEGSAAGYSGPFYELYQTGDRIDFGRKSRTQEKLYFLNSDNLLIERITYEIERQGRPVRVEVRLSHWSPLVEGQLLPTVITRSEDGAPVLALTFTSASIGPKQSDGLLGSPSR
jgi:hypothetical protein